VGDDVGCGEIVAEEKIFQAERRDEDQTTGGDTRLSRTFNKERMPSDDGSNPASERIHGANKRQDKSERTEYIHGAPPNPRPSRAHQLLH
jgi:hypothetical protein